MPVACVRHRGGFGKASGDSAGLHSGVSASFNRSRRTLRHSTLYS